ncbi:hypothetical protein B5J92_05270 [Moraxella atlantae]|nr:hypothetical protein B5J92_05270 [Moraxella atlantae]
MGNNAMMPTNSAKGFTLIELMVVVIIIAILAAMAAPSMSRQIQQMRVIDGANVIESAFKDARTQAQIYQKSTFVELTNTAVDKRMDVKFVDSTDSRSRFALSDGLTITPSTASLSKISFTPQKHAFENNTGTGTALNNTTKISVCSGTGVDRYSVFVDGNSNIVTQKDGTC